MSYKTYNNYKNSNIDWIKEIPNNWSTHSLKNVVNIIMGQSPNSDDINTEQQGILFMQGNADFSEKYPNPSEYCTAPKKISREGDILMSVRAPVGELNISDKKYGIGRGLCSIKPIKVDVQYLWYYLIKSKTDFDYYSNGSTFDAITISDLSSFPIVVPSLDEQKQIGNYLHCRINKIDNRIAKNQNLIKLLEEKRVALINWVVTKGLNPDVPMKDSGVDWIGEIPKHWIVNQLKHVSDIIMGQSPNSNDINDEKEGVLFMQGNAEFTNLYPNPSEYCSSPKKISREGDILMSVRAPVGELNISDKRYGIGRGLCSIKPIKVGVQYLWYYLIKSKTDFDYYSNGSTFDAITIGNLLSFPITVPPLNEQKEIGNYLNRETSKIDKIISKIRENIILLEEYKTSLIYHVVTGKIDVRSESL